MSNGKLHICGGFHILITVRSHETSTFLITFLKTPDFSLFKDVSFAREPNVWEGRHIPSKQSKQTAVTVQCLACFHYFKLRLKNVLNIQVASDNTEFSSPVSALPQS